MNKHKTLEALAVLNIIVLFIMIYFFYIFASGTDVILYRLANLEERFGIVDSTHGPTYMKPIDETLLSY